MTVKQAIIRQYREQVNTVKKRTAGISIPPEGWIRAVRKALGMSAAQLARRLGVTRAAVSNTEKAEIEGGVTLKTMHHMAEAMDSRFIYAIVPQHTIEKLLRKQALKKAQMQVEAAGIHMALENQLPGDRQLKELVNTLAKELMEKSSSKLWDDE